MLDPRLLEILVCPGCKGDLEYKTDGEETLVCHQCEIVFPVRDGIPVMLLEDAVPVKKENREQG